MSRDTKISITKNANEYFLKNCKLFDFSKFSNLENLEDKDIGLIHEFEKKDETNIINIFATNTNKLIFSGEYDIIGMYIDSRWFWGKDIIFVDKSATGITQDMSKFLDTNNDNNNNNNNNYDEKDYELVRYMITKNNYYTNEEMCDLSAKLCIYIGKKPYGLYKFMHTNTDNKMKTRIIEYIAIKNVFRDILT